MLAGKTAVNKIFKKLARAGGERMAPAVLYRFLGFGVDVRSTWVTFCIVIVSSTVFISIVLRFTTSEKRRARILKPGIFYHS